MLGKQFKPYGFHTYCVEKNHNILYNIFGLKKNFTKNDIKMAYRKTRKKNHPDLNSGKRIKFLETQKAYEILSNALMKREYDNLGPDEYKKFEELWKKEFDPANETAYQQTNKKSKQSFYDRIFKRTGHYLQTSTGFVTNFFRKSKDQTQDKPNFTLGSNNYISNHLHFIVDISDSMFFKTERQTTRISECLSAMIDLLSDVSKKNGQMNISLAYFAKRLVHQIDCKTIEDSLIQFLQIKEDKLSGLAGFNTKMYDAVREVLDTTQKKGITSATTFIVFTDGYDTKSTVTLENLAHSIKKDGNVKIIILTYNIDAKNLKLITENAKFGRILRIGSNYEFKTMEEAFEKTKELIISPDNNHSDDHLRNTFHF